MPTSNPERLERLCSDALYLQSLADKADADIPLINELTDLLRRDVEYNQYIGVNSGLIESIGCNNDLEERKMFVPLSDSVRGSYQGLMWRDEDVSYPDGTTDVTWRLCHAVGGQKVTYIDDDGDQIERTPISYISVDGSSLEIIAPTGSHDYRRIAFDGLCLAIDQTAIDDRLNLTEKAEIIARFFSFNTNTNNNGGLANITRQRISYLNELSLFTGAIVNSPIAISRLDNRTCILAATAEGITAQVNHIELDNALTAEYDWIEGRSCLSYEVELDDFGQVSIPHIPGVTKLYSLE